MIPVDLKKVCEEVLEKTNDYPVFQSYSKDCSKYVYCESTLNPTGEENIVHIEFECGEGECFSNEEQNCIKIDSSNYIP